VARCCISSLGSGGYNPTRVNLHYSKYVSNFLEEWRRRARGCQKKPDRRESFDNLEDEARRGEAPVADGRKIAACRRL
jgi:hypothetical protein